MLLGKGPHLQPINQQCRLAGELLGARSHQWLDPRHDMCALQSLVRAIPVALGRHALPNLTPKDFREMEQAGFPKDEIQEMIAFAAYWTMNIVFSQAALAGLSEE